jgi:hypothetical protein
LRTSSMTGQRSERVLRAVASVAVVGKPSRAATATVRPQQEGAAAVVSQALVPHDRHQGRGRTCSRSRSTGGREAAEAPTDGDSALGGADQGSHPGQPLSAPEVLVM